MNNRDIVSDHLQFALLATPPHKAFLVYLIQMALAESKEQNKTTKKPVKVIEEVYLACAS